MKKYLKYINLITSLAFGVLFFIILNLKENSDTKFNLIASIILFLLALIFFRIYDKFHDFKQKNFYKSFLAKKIIHKLNFKKGIIESDTYGIQGTYNGYFFKIFYDFATLDKDFKSNNVISIALFHKSHDISDPELYERLPELNKKYSRKFMDENRNYQVYFDLFFVKMNVKNSFVIGYYTILDKMKLLIEIAKKENLAPVSENEVTKYSVDSPIALE